MHEPRDDSPSFGLKHSLNRRRMFLRGLRLSAARIDHSGDVLCFYFSNKRARSCEGHRHTSHEPSSFQIHLAVTHQLHYSSSALSSLSHRAAASHVQGLATSCVSAGLLAIAPLPPRLPTHPPSLPSPLPPPSLLSFSCSSLYPSLEVNIGRRSLLLRVALSHCGLGPLVWFVSPFIRLPSDTRRRRKRHCSVPIKNSPLMFFQPVLTEENYY